MVVGNDYGYEVIYVWMVKVMGCKGDILIVMFIFGNFLNVLLVVEVVCE